MTIGVALSWSSVPTNVTSNVHSLGYAAGHGLRSLLESAPSSIPSDATHATFPVHTADLFSYLRTIPARYGSWWIALVTDDPIHVLIETVLLGFVAYMALNRRSSSSRRRGSPSSERLTEREEDELLREWKEEGRAPLAPPLEEEESRSGGEDGGGTARRLVIERVEGAHLVLRQTDGEVEEKKVGIAATAKSTTTTKGKTKKNRVDKRTGTTKTRRAVNFATYDFLGVASSTDAKDASRAALDRYGCGSCGPRGFYGTIDAHLDLEKAMADFAGTEGAIMYSDGASACASTVAAFAKRGDLLVVDEAVSEALGTGVTLSRANVRYFRHNDMGDLRRVLEKVRETDKSLKRKSPDQRRFIVAEGLYRNRGSIAPLKEIAALKEEFCYRLILDESLSFGTLGKTGRGALEHFGLRPMVDVEIICISLENALGSIGGVTVGNDEVVDHQRLSGAGYCFSASAPPFVAAAAVASLNRMRDRPDLVQKLAKNAEVLRRELEAADDVFPSKVVVTSDDLSPIVFLELAEGVAVNMTREEQVAALDSVASHCLKKGGVALISTGGHVVEHLHLVPPPSLRMTLSASQSSDHIKMAVQALREAVLAVLKS